MKFYSYSTLYEMTRDPELRNHYSFRLSWSDFYKKWIRRLFRDFNSEKNDARKSEIWNLLTRGQMEGSWYEKMRPYYKVWPSISSSLTRMSLDVSGSSLNLPESTLCIRFVEGNPLQRDNIKIYSILFGVSQTFDIETQSELPPVLAFTPLGTLDDRPIGSFTYMISLDEKTLSDLLNEDIGRDKIEEELRPLFLLCLRVCVTMALLAEDPSIIQPDVLAADRNRFDRSADPSERQRLIDKARKRGIVGFRVGEQYETIPHYRRPHPALYHVGKGRKEQRILFRSGCVVHREKMTKVPTGYITPEGVEVES